MSNEYEETMDKVMGAYQESTGHLPTGQDLNTVENLVIEEVDKNSGPH